MSNFKNIYLTLYVPHCGVLSTIKITWEAAHTDNDVKRKYNHINFV